MTSLKLTWSGFSPDAAREIYRRAIALAVRCSEYDKALGGVGLKATWQSGADILEATLRPVEPDPGAVGRLDQIHAILLSAEEGGGPAVTVTRLRAGDARPG